MVKLRLLGGDLQKLRTTIIVVRADTEAIKVRRMLSTKKMLAVHQPNPQRYVEQRLLETNLHV